MKYVFDHDYHIHSGLSLCSNDPEQNPERILRYAEENGLKTICVTDHFWDDSVPGATDWYKQQNYKHISRCLPLPQSDKVKFLFGCETDLDRHLTLGVALKNMDLFDMILIPTTHLHMNRFTISEGHIPSLKSRALLWASRLEGVLKMPLPFGKVGIAHLTCGLLVPWSREECLETIERIPSEVMETLFAKAASLGVGIELNAADMSFSEDEADIILRPYRIAKKQGCKFYCGSDAHHPRSFEKVKEIFERAVDYLNLEETDKFHIAGAE